MTHYDFFIAGRWRNKENIKPVLDAVRASGKSAYCFIENEFKGEAVEFGLDRDAETFMQEMESLPQDHPFIRKVFEVDMAAQRAADNFLVVLPAGIAAHIEIGVAYGMGKKCYALGQLEKTETLYSIFDEIFPDLPTLAAWLREQ
jgi:hypothetical protein